MICIKQLVLGIVLESRKCPRNPVVSCDQGIQEWLSCKSIVLADVTGVAGKNKVPCIVRLQEGPGDEMVNVRVLRGEFSATVEAVVSLKLIFEDMSII